MLLNLSDIISLEEFAQPFVIRRKGKGIRSNSLNNPGEFEQIVPDININVIGSIQPLKGRDRLNLPEGERAAEGVVAYLKDDINVESIRVGTNQSDGDSIIFDGINYLIRSVRSWHQHGHYKIIAIRLEGQSD